MKKDIWSSIFQPTEFPFSNVARKRELDEAAAEQGDAVAQYFTAMCYLKGDGVKQNVTRGMTFLSLAAAQGHEGAEKALKEKR